MGKLPCPKCQTLNMMGDPICYKCGFLIKGEPLTIKDHIRGNVTFQYYRDSQLFYKTETGLVFPVPIDDTGNATFLSEDKAMLFMRYIRKHLEILKDKGE